MEVVALMGLASLVGRTKAISGLDGITLEKIRDSVGSMV